MRHRSLPLRAGVLRPQLARVRANPWSRVGRVEGWVELGRAITRGCDRGVGFELFPARGIAGATSCLGWSGWGQPLE